jgi:hypothetical protein
MKNTTLYGPSLFQALPSLPLTFLFPPLLDHVGSSPIVFKVDSNVAFAPSTTVEWMTQKFKLGSTDEEPGGEMEAIMDKARLDAVVDVVFFSNHEASFILTVSDALGNIRSEEARNDKVLIWCVKSGDDIGDDDPVYTPLDFNSSFIGQGRLLIRFTPFSVGTFRLLVAINPPMKRNDTSYREYERIALKAEALAGPTISRSGGGGMDRRDDTLSALRRARVLGGEKVKLERTFFIMKFIPGVASDDLRENSFVYGQSVATAGEEGVFSLQLVDRGGNNASGRSNLKVEATLAWRSGISEVRGELGGVGLHFSSISVTALEKTEGFYSVHYTAENSGVYDCSILIDGSITDSSPFEIRIVPSRPRSHTSFLISSSPSIAVFDESSRLTFNAMLSVGGIVGYSLFNLSAVVPIIASTGHNGSMTAFTGSFAFDEEKITTRSSLRRIVGTGSVVSLQKRQPLVPILNAVKAGDSIILSGVRNGRKVVSVEVTLRDTYGNIVRTYGATCLWAELRRDIVAAVGNAASVRGYVEEDKDEEGGIIKVTVTFPLLDGEESIDGSSFPTAERLNGELPGSDSNEKGEYWLDVFLLEPTESEGERLLVNRSLSSIGKHYSSHGLSLVFSNSVTSSFSEPSPNVVLIDTNPFHHDNLWAEDAAIGAADVEWFGFLRAKSTAHASILLVCDGPCTLVLDRKEVAKVTSESLSNYDNEELATRRRLLKSAGLNDSLMFGASIGFFNMRLDQAYAFALTLSRRKDVNEEERNHTKGGGFLRLFWSWREFKNEEIADGGINVEGKMEEVDVEQLYWGGRHVQGSPVAVRVE